MVVLDDDAIDDIFTKIDIDNSGYIDYSEFIAAAMDIDKILTGERL